MLSVDDVISDWQQPIACEIDFSLDFFASGVAYEKGADMEMLSLNRKYWFLIAFENSKGIALLAHDGLS